MVEGKRGGARDSGGYFLKDFRLFAVFLSVDQNGIQNNPKY